ncbi:hypothetical protein COY17_02115 [Candidatus Saccharibacteria bacterium CG_4_10_14_0_2_um_filter_52_9]|nr:MAG: hypothetical protein COY17_02115 [Candidatus Saccharibacteria bacterium CG_4_10_14_0_2_um_filter_52_9]
MGLTALLVLVVAATAGPCFTGCLCVGELTTTVATVLPTTTAPKTTLTATPSTCWSQLFAHIIRSRCCMFFTLFV